MPNLKSILIAHPGRQHVFAVVEALSRSFSITFASTLVFTLKPYYWLPRSVKDLLSKKYLSFTGQLVLLSTTFEILHQCAVRLSFPTRLIRSLKSKRNKSFDSSLHSFVRHLASKPDVIICFDTSSSCTTSLASDDSCLVLLEQTIGHITSAVSIYSDETALHPKFSHTLPSTPPSERIQDCIQEVKQAHYILSPSLYVDLTLEKIGLPKSKIIRNHYSVDINKFTPAAQTPPSIPLRLIFVGQVSQRKGLSYMLDAISHFSPQQVTLTIIGHASPSVVKILSTYSCITYIPFVSPATLLHHLQNSHVFLFPSLHEGSSIACLEALACGLPLITTFNSGTPITHAVEGFVVPIRDTIGIVDAIDRFLNNPSLLQHMSSNARYLSLRFSSDIYAERYTSLLHKLYCAYTSSKV